MRPGRWSRLARILLTTLSPLLGWLAACNGDEPTGGNPPVLVVTTIVVSPAPVTIAVEDTVRLVATAKDQNGKVLSGKTPTWRSSDRAIATVSDEGVVTGVAEGEATITATIEGKHGRAQLSVTPFVRIPVEAAASRTQTVTFAGGTITVTASSGLVYVLEIPANAIDSAVSITMTPVKQFNHLPLSGGLVGAVELAPAGLQFRLPATLRIKTSPTVPAGQKLVAIHYGSGGEVVVAAPARKAAGEVSLLITEIGVPAGPAGTHAHAVSATGAASNGGGSGAAIGTSQDIANLPLPPTTPANLIAKTQLAGLSMPADEAAILAIMRGAYFRSVQNAATQATTPTEIRNAIFAWGDWRSAVIPLDTPTRLLDATLIPEARFLFDELIRAFKRIRPALDQQCIAQRDAIAGFNVLALQGTLFVYDEFAMLAPAGIDRSAVLASSCVQVFVSQQEFPDPAPPNQASPLNLRFGLKFGTDPNLLNSVFAIRFDVTGSTRDGRVDNTTDDLGKFTTQVTPTGQTPLTVTGFACVPEATNRFAFDLCAVFNISRGFGRVINGSVTITTDAGLAQISDVAKVTGSLIISGADVSSTDLRELPVLSEVGGTLVVASLPNLTSLGGMKSLAKLNSLRLQGNPKMTSLAGLDRIEALGALELFSMDELQLVGPLLSLHAVHALRLVDLPKVQSLAGLRGISVTPLTSASRTVIEIRGLATLTTVADLEPLPAVFSGDLILGRLPLVTDNAFLQGVTEIVGDLELRDYSAAPPELDALAKVDDELRINGGMTSFTGLANLGDVGNVLVDVVAVPALSVLSLPSVINIEERLNLGFGNNGPCPRTVPLRVSLPALTRIGSRFDDGFTNPVPLNCQVDLHLPALSSYGSSIQLSFNGLHDLTLGPISGDITVSGNASGTLVALRFTGRFSLGGINLQRLPLLQTIEGPGGTLTGALFLINNPSLSQSAAEAWAANVSASNKIVQGNTGP